MKPDITIRHRRLFAFYNSKVLNALMIVIIVNLCLINLWLSIILPAICGALSLLFFISYSLWFWIKKPGQIVINRWLADVTGYFVIYALIVNAMKGPNQWWLIFPVVCSVVLLFLLLINNKDEQFTI